MNQDINFGAISEALNNKADIDLVNAVGGAAVLSKNTINGWGMPDYSNGQSLAPNTPAPFDGWLFPSVLFDGDNVYMEVRISDAVVVKSAWAKEAWGICQGSCLIKKGQTYTIIGNGTVQSIQSMIYPFSV